MLHWTEEENEVGNASPGISKDTEKGGLTWEEALSLAADRREWMNWIAQCLSREGLKVYGEVTKLSENRRRMLLTSAPCSGARGEVRCAYHHLCQLH